MKKILVTGGAGFIGSAVVRYIINNTQDAVINLDKLTYAGNLENLTEVSENTRYHFEQVDICNRSELDRVFSTYQPDAVMHLAAESHVDRSIDGPAAFIETNIIGTYTLLEAARAYWGQLDDTKKQNFRFHHISTDEVYGDLPHPDDPDSSDFVRTPPVGVPNAESTKGSESSDSVGADLCVCPSKLPLFTEQTAYAPSSPYSASKASSDHLVRAWHRTYGLPVIVTNCSNNYGPYHFPEKLIPHVILNALAGKPLPIYGDGSQIRDWLYVEDHAVALYKVVSEGKIGETYNIGGHNEKRNIEVVHAICEILDELRPIQKNGFETCLEPTKDKSAESTINFVGSTNTFVGSANTFVGSTNTFVGSANTCVGSTNAFVGSTPVSSYKNLITFVQDRPGHDRRYAIDASKIAKELNWQPQETFETGLRKTVQWYLERQ